MKQYDLEFKHSVEGDCVEAVLHSASSIDSIAYKVLQTSPMDNVIPFTRRDMDGMVTLRFNTSGYVALHYRLDTYYSGIDDYLELGIGIVKPMLDAKDYMADYHDFVFSPEYVFCSSSERKMDYIMIPSDEYRASDDEMIAFFREVLTRPKVSDAADFQINVFRMFDSGSVTLKGLYQMFYDEKMKRSGGRTERSAAPARERMRVEAEKPVNREAIKPVASQENAPNPIPAENTPKASVSDIASLSSASPDDAINALFGTKDKKNKKGKKDKKEDKKPAKVDKKFSLFGGGKKDVNAKPLPQAEQNVPEVQQAPVQRQAKPLVPVRRQESDSNRTMLMNEMGAGTPMAAGPKMTLVDSPFPGAPKEISLSFEKDHISIGRIAKDQPPCDVRFPSEFRRIGRHHAWIERGSDGELYLVDMGSANHTTLNGEELVPNRKYRLSDGAEVGFSATQPVTYRVSL